MIEQGGLVCGLGNKVGRYTTRSLGEKEDKMVQIQSSTRLGSTQDQERISTLQGFVHHRGSS
ncbi:hypothetical protein DPMN_032247 [Dreissena polymorpha]|uniref:Uncharacterized protein n=1 Tax=Dreissena polymorpha TaxID=45954 RepID=A0A9D4M3L2_DREPO|nr:hypothetical protein DPMN_032247 [Dreissena polymorpha]